MYPGKVAVMA
jgi:hypothetical protein